MSEPFFKISARVPKKLRDARNIVTKEIRDESKELADLTTRKIRNQIKLSGAYATRSLYNALASRIVRNDYANAWFTRAIFFKPPADKFWKYVNAQKNAGKVPVEQTGNGWAPLPHIIPWLRIRGIPQSRWFVALRGMADRFVGYRFVEKALRDVRPLAKMRMSEAIKRAAKKLKS